jgi:hypothetical protein
VTRFAFGKAFTALGVEPVGSVGASWGSLRHRDLPPNAGSPIRLTEGIHLLRSCSGAHPDAAWLKLQALVDGAKLASKRLW